MQRWRMKELLAEQERTHPRLFASLLTAMRPLMQGQATEPGGFGEG